jgi:sugar/nucleoside kinase (ribokinase family)
VPEPYVVCVGAATLDTILAVPRHPAADDRVIASGVAHGGGGPAATAAVALARLGVPAFLVGAVGDDDAGAAIRAGLEREDVDVSGLAVVAGARSYQSTILVAGETRAIVSLAGPEVVLDGCAEELCRGAAWVHVDQSGYGAVQRLAGDVRLSVDAGNPIPDLDLERVDLYGPTEATDDGRRAKLTVVTRGERGCTAYLDGRQIDTPAFFTDEVVSTLGAGDVFHGALLACLVRGLELEAALVRASACAGMSCRALDGRSAIPSWDELERSLP